MSVVDSINDGKKETELNKGWHLLDMYITVSLPTIFLQSKNFDRLAIYNVYRISLNHLIEAASHMCNVYMHNDELFDGAIRSQWTKRRGGEAPGAEGGGREDRERVQHSCESWSW